MQFDIVPIITEKLGSTGQRSSHQRTNYYRCI